MSKCYFVANYTITDPARYAGYPPRVGPMVSDVEGAVGSGEVLEGEPRHRTVVLEFDSRARFESWYYSAEYQDVLPLRLDSGEGWAIVLDQAR